MNKRVTVIMFAASALVLAACASATSRGSAPLPVAGPDGLRIQQVSVPKLSWSLFGSSQATQTVKLPSRFERGEDEATPPLANLIIAKAQAAERVQDRALLKQQAPMQYAEHCHGMED